MKIITVYKLEPDDPPWLNRFNEQMNLCLFVRNVDPDAFEGYRNTKGKVLVNGEFTLHDLTMFSGWVERVVCTGRAIVNDKNLRVPLAYYEQWDGYLKRLQLLHREFLDWVLDKRA